jgi:5-formyltetrahydrofolate cyclo-ligase
MDKQEIRKEIKTLCSQNKIFLAQKSTEICKKILTSLQYNAATSIFAYMALPDEVDLTPVIQDALENGKTVAVPKIISQSENIIKFFYLEKTKNLTEQTATGTYNILEPDESLPARLDPAQKTLILVPGRAFTKEGDRLGRGKGYYDRFLGDVLLNGNRKDIAAYVILAGVCFDFQIKKSLPIDDRDIKMDLVFSILQE